MHAYQALISQSLNRRIVFRPGLTTLQLFDSLGNIMKKYLYAGVLTACLSVPAFAANNQSPEEPVHRRSILLCMAAVLGLQAMRFIPRLPARNPVQANNKT
jgi:formate-dependent nitrite reductase membrane component NrfD